MDKKPTKILLMDRSGAELDDDCGMAFFWNRVWHPPGRPEVPGIVAAKESIYLAVGREIHEDFAMIAEMDDLRIEAIEERAQEITKDLTETDFMDQDMMETLYRRLGWLAANALFIEPVTRARYSTIFCEDEIILDREPLWVPVTPDRVLQERGTGKVHYREYKSTASAGYKWTNSWPFAIQLHLGMKALEEELKVPVEYGQIMGLFKGYPGVDGLRHPYVWAYRNVVTGAWTSEWDKAVPRAAWERKPIWEHPDGVVRWVQHLGEDVARTQFPFSAPVTLNNDMVEGWVRRKLHRARVVEAVREAALDNLTTRELHFEQRTKKCRPAYGDPCAYLPLCWNASMQAEPLRPGSGFVPRVPHHEVEINWREDQRRGIEQ